MTELVKKGHLPTMQLVEKMSTNPARVLGIPKGTLSVGSCADICIADPNETYVINDRFYSKANNSPFIGWKVQGQIKMTILDGRIVYRDGKLTSKEELV